MAGAVFAALAYLGAEPALAQTNLRIDKKGAMVDGRAGSRIATFTIVVSNPAVPETDTAANVHMDDPLPGAGVIDWKIASETSLFGCGIDGFFPAQQTLSCDPGPVYAGQAYTVVVAGVAPDICLTLDNTATAIYRYFVDGEAVRATVQGSGSVNITSATCRPVFVIGDNEPHDVGSFVNFWGAQWWDNNFMSGPVSNGVASFKGYASNADTACGPGATWVWDTRPGNSSNPPAAIPNDVMVIVTDTVQKDGSDIKGNIKKILLVRSDGAYGPNPGHRGDGSVVEVLCSAQ